MRVAWRGVIGRRSGLLRRLGGRVRRVGTGTGVLALAVPLAWPSGAGGQHLDLPSAASVRSGVVRLADWVTGQGTPTQQGQGGQPGSAAGGKRVGPPSASQGRAHAQGRALFSVPGTVPAYRVHGPSVKQFTTGPEAGGTGSSYDAATSVLVQAGTNATASLYQNADGTYTERLYGSPANAKDAGGVVGAGRERCERLGQRAGRWFRAAAGGL